MMEAAEIAGLKIVDFITEPNAAAMAYSLYLQSNIKQILVYDFGGGTLDVSIIRYDTGENITVLSVAGDPHLGGNDFDARLVNHFMDQYDLENQSRKFPRTEHSVVQRLYRECRRVKEALSTSDREIKLQLSHVNGNESLIKRLTKDIFNKVCGDQIDGTIFWVNNALETVNMTANDIDQVLLVGGSSRIPKVREMLEKKFGSKKVLKSPKFIPEYAIALGAAIRANDLEKITNTTPVRAALNDTNNTSAIGEKVEAIPNSSESTANQPGTSNQNKTIEPELGLVPGSSKQGQPSKADVIYNTFKNLVVSEKKLIEVIADTVSDIVDDDKKK
ncbi:hypothetical protein WR25_04784 [Diploscapter pachys]|uniref:Uncharacterized protein n=1 Tax=Diploscapter pachys TaxID=2018661 RepID=A0A2A2L4A0_9BILA|nr:hypothetical protein WR25_04784 [Diploscapter pachys]